MINKEFEDLLGPEEPIENVKLDLEVIKANLPSYTNEKLCEMIVCDRYFGFDKKIDIICMEELVKRRIAGDQFHFESYIEKCHKELPVLDFTIPDIRTVLNNIIASRNNGK